MLRSRLSSVRSALLTIVCLAALAVAVAGCGDDASTDGSSPGSEALTTEERSTSTAKAGSKPSKTAKPPPAIQISEQARKAGAQACRDVDPKAALERFAASASKAGYKDVAATRKGLLTRARQLRKADADAKAPAIASVPLAAASAPASAQRSRRSARVRPRRRPACAQRSGSAAARVQGA